MTKHAATPAATCPCGLAPAYEACCGQWHRGPLRLQAPDAERLMRSRYSAYVLGLGDYLLETWHPRNRPAGIDANPPGLRWLGLDVRRYLQQDDDHAIVEFVARHQLNGRATRLQEISRFERLDGRWVYVEAEG